MERLQEHRKGFVVGNTHLTSFNGPYTSNNP